jgi:mRNA interferase MazF
VIKRGDIYWVNFGTPEGSAPGYRRPAIILQSNTFNQTQIQTTICGILTSNLNLLEAPGNILIEAKVSGLPKDSVLNLSQIYTVDKSDLEEKVASLPERYLPRIDASIRMVMDV